MYKYEVYIAHTKFGGRMYINAIVEQQYTLICIPAAV